MRVRGRTLPGRAAVLGAGGLTGAVVLAVLLAGMLSGAGSPAHTAPPPAAPSRTSLAATVQVSAGSLAGQPLSAVRRQLQQLGLTVRVRWQPSGQDPGTVLSVQPSGPVPAGSVIAITAAAPPHHGRHGHGDGHGNGDGGN